MSLNSLFYYINKILEYNFYHTIYTKVSYNNFICYKLKKNNLYIIYNIYIYYVLYLIILLIKNISTLVIFKHFKYIIYTLLLF